MTIIRPLKVIFAGTPEFAVSALQALIESPHEIVAVYTQPDRPAGRGLKLTPSPVKVLAQEQGLKLLQPATLKGEEDAIKFLNADVMAVAAYGLLIPASVLRIPPLGCVNIHPSLLPRWRGAAPIQRTIEAGDKVSGVTIMQMDEGLDTGPTLIQHRYTLTPNETAQTLHDRLAHMGAEALIETLNFLAQGTLKPEPQDNALATYANKLTKEEGLIDWTLPAHTIENMVRAFNPWPVAYTAWHQENMRVWMAKAMNEEHQAIPATILRASTEGIDVATGKGVLRLLQVQLPGGKAISAADFYLSRKDMLKIGKPLL